jgi:putative tryptophan/tyrosine transport system substrate-binding protein
MNFGFSILDFGLRRGRISKTTWIGFSSGPNRKSKIKIRKLAGILAVVITLALGGAVAQAQQPAKVPRIGYLTGASLSSQSANTEAFRQGLRELGYIEGKNIVIEWRAAEGNRDHQRALAVELVGLKVDVIVASSGGDTLAAKGATATTPIVMAQTDDPVATGFVDSLPRPGRNITGLSTLSPETSGKRLELLKEVVPKLSRVAVFGTSSSPGNAPVLNETRLAAVPLGVSVQSVDVLSPKDFESAFQAATKAQANGALWVVSGSIGSGHQAKIAELAVKSRLPTIYERQNYVSAGGLMSYGVNLPDLHRRAAAFVDKILKGAKPADIPVEQPTKFDFIINLKAAKQIGVTIPPAVLARADRVIR